MRATAKLLLATSFALALSGCGGCGPPPVSTDEDGSTPEDAGADAGPGVLDSGVFEDGGLLAEPDGGRLPDGGCPGNLGGTSVPMLTGLNLSRRLAVDATHLYVAEMGTLTEPTGRVFRASRGGGPIEPLIPSLRTPDALVVDDAYVYVSSGDGVFRISKGDKTALRIDASLSSTAVGETSLALTTTQVVFATARNTLVRFGKDGSARAVLYLGPPGSVVRGAVVDGGYVYFLVTASANGGLYRVLLDGSGAAERVSGAPQNARALVLTPSRMLWAEGAQGTGKVMLAPRDGGTAVELAGNLWGPTDPVFVGNHVYFKDSTLTMAETDRFLLRVSLCNPGPAQAVGPVGAGPGGLVLFDGRLFFTSQASGTGYLRRLP